MTAVLTPSTRFQRIVGRFRLLTGACPRCNSDAPYVYSCSVCKQIYKAGEITTVSNDRTYPLTLATKALWWYSWLHPGHSKMQADWDRRFKTLGSEPAEAAY